jgi:hypothetical protein
MTGQMPLCATNTLSATTPAIKKSHRLLASRRRFRWPMEQVERAGRVAVARHVKPLDFVDRRVPNLGRGPCNSAPFPAEQFHYLRKLSREETPKPMFKKVRPAR